MSNNNLKNPYIFRLIFLLVLTISLAILYLIEKNLHDNKRNAAFTITQKFVEKLDDEIHYAISSVTSLASVVKRHNGNIPNFDEVAKNILYFHPNVDALELTEQGKITHIYPLNGNEAAMGLDTLASSHTKVEAKLSKNSNRLILSGPLGLVQGGQAIVARQPITLLNDTDLPYFWGFAISVIKLDKFFNSNDITKLNEQGYSFTLTKNDPTTNLQQTVFASEQPLNGDPETLSISLPNAHWSFNVTPINGWHNLTSLFIGIFLTLIFSAFIAKFFYRTFEQKQNYNYLERIVDERTKQLDEHLKRLQLSVSSADQRLFELDLQSQEILVSNEETSVNGLHTSGQFIPFSQWQENIHPDDFKHVRKNIISLLFYKNKHNFEYREKMPDGHWSWVQAKGEVIERDQKNKHLRVVGVLNNINNNKQREEVLRTLAESATKESNEIFKIIVRQLSNFFDMDMVLIGIIDEKQPHLINTLSAWHKDHYLDNFTYDLNHTPCQTVLEQDSYCLYQKNIQELFPLDEMLAEMEISSYIGVPLKNRKNEVIGLIAMLDKKQIYSESPELNQLLNSLATRASDEIERKETLGLLTLSSLVFSQANEGVLITDRKGNILDVNESFTTITGYTKEEVIGKNPNILNSGHQSSEFYQVLWDALLKKGHWQGEIWNKKKSGELFVEFLSISSLKDKNGDIVNCVGLFSDITMSKQQQEKLKLMAHYDPLTRLPNRILLADRFSQSVAHNKRNKHKTNIAVCFLDLDDFKPINDNFGHDVGDRILIEVAKRIQETIREEDTISRQGGDEFILLLDHIDSRKHCEELLTRILKATSQNYLVEDKKIQVNFSVGISLYPIDDNDLEILIRHADQAMYQAKMAGKNRFSFFNPENDKKLQRKHEQLNAISYGLENQEFQLFYQPKVNMKTGIVYGAEALIRWINPEKGIINPIDFLPTINNTSLEVKLGDWVIQEGVKQLNEWQNHGLNLNLSINISASHLLSDDFISTLKTEITKYTGFDAEALQLEILESSIISDIDQVHATIKNCKNQLGIGFALDDFGTGYSSLEHLRKLSTDTIKIDRGFTKGLIHDPNDYMIIDGIIKLSNAFGREIIAEGVETKEHGLMLLFMGCKNAQGYAISKALPINDFNIWLTDIYEPIQEWKDCALESLTIEEAQTHLLKLGFTTWRDQFKERVYSSMGDNLEWPNFDPSLCACANWIHHARQNTIFKTEWLNTVEQTINSSLLTAQEIHDLHESGDINSAHSKMEQFEQAADKALCVVEQYQ